MNEKIMNITLIRKMSDLTETSYFEFLPGRYRGQSWNETSVFLASDIFALIEPIFERHLPEFNRNGNTNVSKETWNAIIHEMQAMSAKLAGAQSASDVEPQLGEIAGAMEQPFTNDFQKSARALAQTIDDLVVWLQNSLNNHEQVAVLGV